MYVYMYMGLFVCVILAQGPCCPCVCRGGGDTDVGRCVAVCVYRGIENEVRMAGGCMGMVVGVGEVGAGGAEWRRGGVWYV